MQQEDQQMLDQVYEKIVNSSEEAKLQFCLTVAPHTTFTQKYFSNNPVLKAILQNHHKSPNFLS